jgi:hypothetical protein
MTYPPAVGIVGKFAELRASLGEVLADQPIQKLNRQGQTEGFPFRSSEQS